ncbi:MAG: thioredoxin [Abditibacteriales bacterium]|nr:thioredoxin [Abditibacteriales bacterium]MDW8366313.1 thioredoxin [Abditibacteriales bacterium]
MSDVKHVTTQGFESEVLRAEQPVLVDFYATWCPPCKMLAPILDKLAEEFAGRVKVVKVNVEEEYPLAVRYGISGVPTLMLFKGGVIVDTMVGLLHPQALKAKLEQVAPAPQPTG